MDNQAECFTFTPFAGRSTSPIEAMNCPKVPATKLHMQAGSPQTTSAANGMRQLQWPASYGAASQRLLHLLLSILHARYQSSLDADALRHLQPLCGRRNCQQHPAQPRSPGLTCAHNLTCFAPAMHLLC